MKLSPEQFQTYKENKAYLDPFMKKKTNKQVAMFDREYWSEIYTKQLLNLVMARFEWHGLPDNMPAYFVERTLVENGYGAFINDPEIGLIFSSGSFAGTVTHYNTWTKFNAISPTYHKTWDWDDEKCFVLGNNPMYLPDWQTIQSYAAQLAEIKVTMNINLSIQKTPWVVRTDPTSVDARNLFNQVYNGAPFVEIKRNSNLNAFADVLDVMDLNAPFIIQGLQDHFDNIRNEFLTVIGIQNYHTDKKERSVVSEVEANNMEVAMNAEMAFEMRTRVAKLLSEKLNMEITVSRRGDSFIQAKEMYDEDQMKDGSMFDGDMPASVDDRIGGKIAQNRPKTDEK